MNDFYLTVNQAVERFDVARPTVMSAILDGRLKSAHKDERGRWQFLISEAQELWERWGLYAKGKKRCRKCKEVKSFDKFIRQGPYLRGYCKDCFKSMYKARGKEQRHKSYIRSKNRKQEGINRAG